MANALERLLGMTPSAPNKSEDALADLESPRELQAEDDATPEHLQLQNVLNRNERIISRDMDEYAKIYEEYGIYDTVGFGCTVPQPANTPIMLGTILMSFDTAITSWKLTLGRRVFQFNSTGSNGFIQLTNLNIPLRPGDERSLKPVSGTPAINSSLYLCGKNVRVN